MKYLLDTCIISELIRKKPDQNVINWVSKQDDIEFGISILTFGEIFKGIEKLKDSKRKAKLNHWVEIDLPKRFSNRILNIDMEVMNRWGKITGKAEKRGKPMPAIDSLIAATGLAQDLVVVTRNTMDMTGSGVELLNPWQIQ